MNKVILIALAFCLPLLSIASEKIPEIIDKQGRTLTDKDLGRVFIFADHVSTEPSPNFGKYLVLFSLETSDLYAFETFDIINSKPVGKFLVSYPAQPYYREVKVDKEMMKAARVEIDKANKKLGERIRKSLEQK